MFALCALAFLLFSTSNATPDDLDGSENATSPRQEYTKVRELHIANSKIEPDGYSRSAIVINGKFPGPMILAEKNEHVSITVFNKLTDPSSSLHTSVVSDHSSRFEDKSDLMVLGLGKHWHGILQHKSNWADGTSQITQCPLRQDEAFEYRLNTTGQTGTYWYHSHYGTQYCDGLRGPLIIYDKDDPLKHLYDVDDESTVITLADWYHYSSSYLGTLFSGVQSNATLINGRGRYNGGPMVPLSVIKVQRGKRYRFRVLNVGCAPWYNFTIDGHRMTIIEADGNEVEPVETDSLPVLSGQRYSVIVTADQPVANYWVRAFPNTPTNSTFNGGQNQAILRYDGAPDKEPTSKAGPYEIPFDEGALHPLSNPGAPGIPEIGKADVNIQLVTGINSTGWFTTNGAAYVETNVPLLLQILSGARHPSQMLPSGTVYELPPNKVIEVSFPSPTIAPHYPHPMHLHGHTFDVVRVAGTHKTNFVNPIRRDTVSMGVDPSDNVTIRFVTDNPGPWFFHCHIDWHLHHGFAVVMAETPDETVKQEAGQIPEEWFELCAKRKGDVQDD